MPRQINAEELQTLYLLIGQGIWRLQYVEDALATYITMKHHVKMPGRIPEKKAEKILKKYRKNTLGQLLNNAFDNKIMPPKLEKRFRDFKKERDWLVHRCVHQNGKDLYVDNTRYAIMSRIEDFCVEAGTLQNVVYSELKEFSKYRGVDMEKAERSAQKHINELKGHKKKN